MAMPQRDNLIEAIKRQAAEKKAEKEKKKAEARVCAARCRLKRCPPINRNRRGRNGRQVLRPFKRREPWLCPARG